jgi:3-oxoacyl-[acyl-carrier protein] reductase
VAAEIIKSGGDAITIGANIAKKDELDKMIATVAEKWGSLDVLVNNAGGRTYKTVCAVK